MKKFFEKISNFWRKSIVVSSVFVFALTFLAYSSIYLNFDDGTSTIDDHFFHYKYAQLLRTEGWDAVENFKWIYFTNSVQNGDRYNVTLYHLFLMPFTFINNDEIGLKISDIFLASLAVGVFYFTLRQMKIKYSFLSTLFLMSFYFSVYRFLSGRNLVLPTILIYLEFFLAVKKRYVWLFWLSLFHILWHPNTFFMPLFAIILTEIIRLAITNKIFIKNIFVSIFFTILAMAFFTNFPSNLYQHFLGLFKIHSEMLENENIKSIEGQELKVVDLNRFLSDSEVLFYLAIFSFFVAIFYYFQFKKKQLRKIKAEISSNKNMFVEEDKKINPKEKEYDDLLFYSILLFLLICIAGSIVFSGRFYDFYLPGAVICFALAIKKISWEKKIIINEIFKKYFIVSVFIFLIILAQESFIKNKERIFSRESRPIFSSAQWLEEKSEPKEIIFMNTWDLFPRAFFVNQHNYYIMGMEPRLLLEYDSKLFWLWFNITKNNYYCEKEESCKEEKEAFLESIKDDKEKKEKFNKENSRKIIQSIKKDFQSHLVLSISNSLSATIKQNPEMIEEEKSFEFQKSNSVITAFKLK